MLQIGAGHSNNCQVKLKLFGYDIQIQFQANLEVSEALIIYVTNGRGGGKARRRVMLHIGAGHSNNCQIILKLFGYDIFYNNLQQKISRKFQGIRDINHIRYK